MILKIYESSNEQSKIKKMNKTATELKGILGDVLELAETTGFATFLFEFAGLLNEK